MPFVSTTTGNLYYRLDGAEGKPVLVLSHSLGLDHGMWDPQVEALASHFRVLRFDTRGHGASSAVPGDYTIEQLGGDVLALVDALGIQQFAYCGLSLGGMVGQWLAVHAAGRLTHLVLANTTARVSDPSAMEARRRTVLESGMAAIADTVMARFFSSASLEQNPPVVASARRTLLSTSVVGYAGCCAAVRDMGSACRSGPDRRSDARHRRRSRRVDALGGSRRAAGGLDSRLHGRQTRGGTRLEPGAAARLPCGAVWFPAG